MMAQRRAPRLYLGTMTFAWTQSSSFVDDTVASEFVSRFSAAGGTYIDTARIYAGGETEPMLGRVLSAANGGATASASLIGTKAHPSQPAGLSPEGLRSQLKASLGAVGVKSFSEFYLHQPDTENALLASLREADAMVKEGAIGAIGMSNYHRDEMLRAFELCETHGLTKPSVYQGLCALQHAAIRTAAPPTSSCHPHVGAFSQRSLHARAAVP